MSSYRSVCEVYDDSDEIATDAQKSNEEQRDRGWVVNPRGGLVHCLLIDREIGNGQSARVFRGVQVQDLRGRKVEARSLVHIGLCGIILGLSELIMIQFHGSRTHSRWKAFLDFLPFGRCITNERSRQKTMANGECSSPVFSLGIFCSVRSRNVLFFLGARPVWLNGPEGILFLFTNGCFSFEETQRFYFFVSFNCPLIFNILFSFQMKTDTRE